MKSKYNNHQPFVILAIISLTLAVCFFNHNPQMVIEPDNSQKSEFSFTFTDTQYKKIDNYFDKLCKCGFNGVVLIGQRDSIFYFREFGYANYALRDTLTPQSAFQLASISKQFTAVSVLQLYERGMLNLTDSIDKYFPDFAYKGVTIHQLLVHRSGLPNYHYFMDHMAFNNDTSINNNFLIKQLSTGNIGRYFNPDRRFQYSNTGYAVLASIVEKVSGMSFTDYLNKNIFEPLNMSSAFTYTGKGCNNIPNTVGYAYRWRPADDNVLDRVLGDKGIYCSATDLFKWDQGLYKGIILNPDTLALAFEPMGKAKHQNPNYGYGWRLFNYGADTTKISFHAGWWHGFKNLIIRVPSDKTTAIILKNRVSGANPSTRTILNLLYPVAVADSLSADTAYFDSDSD